MAATSEKQLKSKTTQLNNSKSSDTNSTESFTIKSDARLTANIIKTRRPRISQNTIVSVQNLQFPETIPNKARLYKVKRQSNLLQFPDSKSSSLAKERGYDFTSSTNPNFEQILVTVPKNFHAKCSSTSMDTTPRKSQSLETLKSLRCKRQPDKETSQELVDSHHKFSTKPKNLQGSEWQLPCKESFVVGAPRKFLGNCPPNYEQIAKLSKSRQKFFLTQDPRKVHCLVNPDVLRTKKFSQLKEFSALTKMVQQAQNVCVSTASESSEDFICEVIDLENPLQLDFQGMDYSKTYEQDEQDLLNQRNYRRVCRYMERRRLKGEIRNNIEEDLHQEMINVPKSFGISDRNNPRKTVLPKPKPKLGELYRSADKPHNQKLLNIEREQRRERYKNLYLSKKERQDQEKKSKEIEHKTALENLPLALADENLKKCVKYIDESIEKSAGKEVTLGKPISERRTFPHTMQETKQFKDTLKQKNLMERDKARIVKEFFLERKGKTKEIPAADLEISSEASVGSNKDSKISEQSTDDEDDIEVGKQGSKFKLRGFQFKMNSNLRGKLTQREKLKKASKEKSCITRDQWLKELAPKKEQIKLDVEMGIQKLGIPDDPNLVLFPPPSGFKTPQAEHSTIRNYVEKSLGRHYDRVNRKNFKFAKPRLRYSVKKFNLIKYRFGDTAKRFSQLKDHLNDEQISKLKSTSEFIAAKALKKKRHLEALKQNRLKLLGIPCKPLKKSRLQTKCENSSSSSDSDWVPEQEPLVEDFELEDRLLEAEKELRPLRMRCNMPAPKRREPTLRQHPRQRRDYDKQRVPSEIFDQIVMTTNLPFMHKLDKDKVTFANVEVKKTPYTEKFEARHHHDHWNATQVQQVDVHYHPHLVKPEITKVKKKTSREIMENFRLANPPCNQFVDMELSLPQYDIAEMIGSYRRNNAKTKAVENGIRKMQNLCPQKENRQDSRDAKEVDVLDHPGRQEYLQLLKDTRDLYEETKQSHDPDKKLYVNKDQLLKELEEDLKSIESCLTSLSSSVCTNFTNDSGSFLLMEGKEKIPLDFLRNSVVPFEELQRSRFQAIPIDIDKEQNNPFQVLPFSGQKKAQLEMTTAKDGFFTFNTRLKNGMRLRLEVPVEDVKQKLLGKGSNKHKGLVATDIDENYVDELKNRPAAKLVKFKSGQTLIKNAMRLKFESMFIQGQVVPNQIYDRVNDKHWNDMQTAGELFENLFAKWEKREYDAAMAVVYKVKRFYDETDSLKTEFKQLERDLAMLNMDIVFIEGHWVRCVMLQNFHYLLGDLEWRLQHDWIHRLDCADNELENFEESIAKRSTLNIRKREKDDAWAIKSFYEEVYLQNKRENLIVFPSADNFLKGLQNLKTNTFIILLQMHFTLAIQTELQYKLESFADWCAQDLREREEYVSRKCAKLYFMDNRVKWLNERTLHFLNEPIAKCFRDESFYKDRAVITEAFRRIVPPNLCGTNGNELYTIDMVGTIFEVMMDILGKFETIPMDLTHRVEKKLRNYRTYVRKQSYQAYHIERRIDMEMKKVVKNLEPPYQKLKRISKLPRYHLKKREKPVPIETKAISERAKFFFRAFNEGELTDETIEVKDSFQQVGVTQEQIVPFYFDHFLKLNGYTPNYNFKTQIELRDGYEIDRLQIKSVIPEVQEHMEYWENLKRKIMDANIAQNPKIYVNVMT